MLATLVRIFRCQNLDVTEYRSNFKYLCLNAITLLNNSRIIAMEYYESRFAKISNNTKESIPMMSNKIEI